MPVKIPEWLPDWTDETQYPNHSELQSWAWEFLRRNVDYQNDWTLAKNHWEMWVFNDDPTDLRESGTFRANDTRSEPIYVHLARKWGLQISIVDPAINGKSGYPIAFELTPGPQEFPYFEVSRDQVASPVSPKSWKEVGFIFDLELPLDPQLKFAKWQLRSHRTSLVRAGKIKPISSRPHLQLFRKYLRCIDAKRVGATEMEIASTFFPEADLFADCPEVRNISNWITASSRLVEVGYRTIVLNIGPPKSRRGRPQK